MKGFSFVLKNKNTAKCKTHTWLQRLGEMLGEKREFN